MKGMDAEWWAKQEGLAEYCLSGADWIKPENRLTQAGNIIYSACGNEAVLDLQKKGIEVEGADKIKDYENQNVIGILSRPKGTYFKAEGFPKTMNKNEVRLLIKSYMESLHYGFINHDNNLFRRPLPVPPVVKEWMDKGSDWETFDLYQATEDEAERFYYDNFVKPFCEVFLEDNWECKIDFSPEMYGDYFRKQFNSKIQVDTRFEDWYSLFEDGGCGLDLWDGKIGLDDVFNSIYIEGMQGMIKQAEIMGDGKWGDYLSENLVVYIMQWIILSIFFNTIVEALVKADYCWKVRNIYKEQD